MCYINRRNCCEFYRKKIFIINYSSNDWHIILILAHRKKKYETGQADLVCWRLPSFHKILHLLLISPACLSVARSVYFRSVIYKRSAKQTKWPQWNLFISRKNAFKLKVILNNFETFPRNNNNLSINEKILQRPNWTDTKKRPATSLHPKPWNSIPLPTKQISIEPRRKSREIGRIILSPGFDYIKSFRRDVPFKKKVYLC